MTRDSCSPGTVERVEKMNMHLSLLRRPLAGDWRDGKGDGTSINITRHECGLLRAILRGVLTNEG